MKRTVALLALSVLLGASGSYVPANGFVPDANTAVRIAEAVLLPVYGNEVVASEKPLHAELNGDIWTVTGTLASNRVGGVAVVRISRRDGHVLYMMHGK